MTLKLKVYPPPSDNVQHGLEVVLAGTYDIPGLSFDKPPVICDIGGHVGSATVFFADRFPGAEIHTYEPSPENAGYCRQNVAGLSTLHEVAVVGDGDPEEMTLYDGAQNTGQRSLHQLGEQKPTGVKVRTLAASKLPPCDILKLDCEGSELPILRSYPHLGGVRALMLEWHRQEDYQELLRWLPTLGFELRRDDAKGDRGVWDRNLIFTRKPAATPSNYDGSIQGLRGEYDLESLPDLKEPKVLDLGANQGNFALYILDRYPGATVWSFEPHPDTFRKMCANVGDKVAVFEAAVTHPARGLVRLYEGVNGSEECSLRDDVRWPHISQRLDKWVEVPSIDVATLPPCDLLKVDTEGSEIEILAGYRHMAGVRVLLVEAHPIGGDLMKVMKQIVGFAEAAGLGGLDVRGTVMRFVRHGEPKAPALQAMTTGQLREQASETEEWVRVETLGGTWRLGCIRERMPGHALRLNPCYFITPERMVVPMPHPGAGLGAVFLDMSIPKTWGDGGEEVVICAGIRKIQTDIVKQILELKQ